jgi:hypothetical protein
MWWPEADADEVSGMDREGTDFDLDLPGPWRRRIGDSGDFQDIGRVAGGDVGDGTCHRWSHPRLIDMSRKSTTEARVAETTPFDSNGGIDGL